MSLSVLTKNLNWESLIKNLVNFNFIMGVLWEGQAKNLIFLGRGRQFSELRGKGAGKKREGVLLPSFWKMVHAMTTLTNQLTPKQIQIFSANDCIIAEILQKNQMTSD